MSHWMHALSRASAKVYAVVDFGTFIELTGYR
jgi:hypothetical protein